MENGDDNQEEQNEEQSPFVPDLGLPRDESVNYGQGGNGGAAAGGAAGGGGGGEAPLSFRRFLDPAAPACLARPDVAAGLPDFVQDHLAPAAAAGAAREVRDWQSPADAAGATAAVTGTRRKVASSVASAAGGVPALPPAQPLDLPDFLSDSLHTVAEPGRVAGPTGARRSARSPAQASQLPIQRLERENASLRRDVERLQQQLQQERVRSSSLQSQLDGSAAAAAVAAAAAAAAADPTEGDSRLQDEVRSLRAQNAELRVRGGIAPSAQLAASQIEAAAASTEQLISQLMSGVRSLRSISANLGPAAAPADPDPDLGRPPR